MYNIISINPRLTIITAMAASKSDATLANALEPPSPINRYMKLDFRNTTHTMMRFTVSEVTVGM